MLAQTGAAIATMPPPAPCSAEHAAQVLDGAAVESVIEGRTGIADVLVATLSDLYARHQAAQE
jgi:hypothetical protein